MDGVVLFAHHVGGRSRGGILDWRRLSKHYKPLDELARRASLSPTATMEESSALDRRPAVDKDSKRACRREPGSRSASTDRRHPVGRDTIRGANRKGHWDHGRLVLAPNTARRARQSSCYSCKAPGRRSNSWNRSMERRSSSPRLGRRQQRLAFRQQPQDLGEFGGASMVRSGRRSKLGDGR